MLRLVGGRRGRRRPHRERGGAAGEGERPERPHRVRTPPSGYDGLVQKEGVHNVLVRLGTRRQIVVVCASSSKQGRDAFNAGVGATRCEIRKAQPQRSGGPTDLA